MVEGHGCHRVVAAHKRLLLGGKYVATSPNGRFTHGAQLVNNKVLSRIEAVGKNLFYFFGDKDPLCVVHIHFGMSGAFRTSPYFPVESRLTTSPTTRLLLVNEEKNIMAALSAMTVAHGTQELWEQKLKMLGPDPLREDADKERLWKKMQTTNKSIGLLLMDQTAVAGIGNIFRAEICYKSKVHPEQPAKSLSREQFEEIWMHGVLLLQRGFKTGSILTVDLEDAKRLGAPWTRRYIYNHKQCGNCKGPVKSWDMATRTVYCCTTCQPLSPSTQLDEKRVKVMATAKLSQEFVSHCASESIETMTPAKMTVALLKAELAKAGLPITGRKADLIERLLAVSKKTMMEMKKEEEDVTEELRPTTPPKQQQSRVVVKVIPGTAHLGKATSAKAAALEKQKAGENRAVEHIALHDDDEEEVIAGTTHLRKVTSATAAALEKQKAGENRAVEHVALHDEEEEEALVVAASSKTSKTRKRRPSISASSSAAPASKKISRSKREYSAEVALGGDTKDIDAVLAAEYE